MVAGAVGSRPSSMMMPLQAVILAARLHIDRDIVRDRGEDAGLQQEGGDLVADFKFIVAEGAQGGRAPARRFSTIAAQHRADGDAERRAGQGEIGHAGGAHDRELAVSAEPCIDEKHDDEAGDGQDGGDEARHQKQRQLHENQRREAVIDDDLDESQGLREPDERDQPGGDQQQRHAASCPKIYVSIRLKVQATIHGASSGRAQPGRQGRAGCK